MNREPRDYGFNPLLYSKAAGVKEDCQKLLLKFQETKSVRFEEFIKIWKEMEFSLIYCGRENEKELMEFTEESLFTALSFALPPHPFQWRTGGLYLLYSLYFKQPAPIKVPIRVTMQDWVHMQDFIKDAKEQNHLDIHFVFRKLEFGNAFLYVAFHELASPSSKTRSVLGHGTVGTTSKGSILELLESGFSEKLKCLEDKYTEMKSMLSLDDEVNTIHERFHSILSEQINSCERKLTGHIHKTLTSGSESDDGNIVEQFSIGKRRAQLKNRGFSQAGSASRSRRHRKVVISTSPTKRSPPKRQQGLKARISIALSSAAANKSDEYVIPDDACDEDMNMPTLQQNEEPSTSGKAIKVEPDFHIEDQSDSSTPTGDATKKRRRKKSSS